MRQSPSGASNLQVISLVGGPGGWLVPAGFASGWNVAVPGVQVCDTVAYSFDRQPGPVLVMSVVVQADNVNVNFYNPTPNDFTITDTTLSLEIFPRGR